MQSSGARPSRNTHPFPQGWRCRPYTWGFPAARRVWRNPACLLPQAGGFLRSLEVEELLHAKRLSVAHRPHRPSLDLDLNLCALRSSPNGVCHKHSLGIDHDEVVGFDVIALPGREPFEPGVVQSPESRTRRTKVAERAGQGRIEDRLESLICERLERRKTLAYEVLVLHRGCQVQTRLEVELAHDLHVLLRHRLIREPGGCKSFGSVEVHLHSRYEAIPKRPDL